MRGYDRRDLGELIVSATLLGLGLFIFFSTFRIAGAAEGARKFPQVYAVVIAGGGLVAFVASLLRTLQRQKVSESAGSPEAVPGGGTAARGWLLGFRKLEVRHLTVRGLGGRIKRVPPTVLVVGASAGYLLALGSIGYVASTVLFGIVMVWLTGRLSVKSVAFVAILTASLYLLFSSALDVDLP